MHSLKLDKFYVGQSEDLTSRIAYHNDERRNRIWTKRGLPWTLALSFTMRSRSEATQLERFIKNQRNKKWLEYVIAARTINWNGKTIAADPDASG